MTPGSVKIKLMAGLFSDDIPVIAENFGSVFEYFDHG